MRREKLVDIGRYVLHELYLCDSCALAREAINGIDAIKVVAF